MNTILVTGAGGLIGKAVCLFLYNNGFNFMAVYHKEPEQKVLWAYIVLDLATTKLRNIHEIDIIIHCAALIPSIENSFERCFEINTKINKNIYEFAQTNSIKKLIFISSTNVYDMTTQVIDEGSPLCITNLYAQEKINAEKMFFTLNNTEVICLRVNAPYHFSTKYNTVLKIFIENACKNIDLVYHGSGERRQDFIHVNDLATIIVKVLLSNYTGIYNVAHGKPITMKELGTKIIELTPSCKSSLQSSSQADSQENNKANFDISKLKKDFDWQPSVTLENGIKEWISFLMTKYE